MQTPAHFEEDFSEIIKREEEESGLKISYSESRKSLVKNVQTSLDEKYDSINSSDGVSHALYDNSKSVQHSSSKTAVSGALTTSSVTTVSILISYNSQSQSCCHCFSFFFDYFCCFKQTGCCVVSMVMFLRIMFCT